jgi:hypothetical protein
VVGRWERYKLSPDYHVSIEGVAYSAPFGLIGKLVDVHCTASLIGIFHRGERVASHPRGRQEPGVLRPAVTLEEHRPPQHRAAARLTPEAVRERVAAMGGSLMILSDKIFRAADHPEQAARQVAGLIALGKTFGADALRSERLSLTINVRSGSRHRCPDRQCAVLCLCPPMAGQRPDGLRQGARRPWRRAAPEPARFRLLPLNHKPN